MLKKIFRGAVFVFVMACAGPLVSSIGFLQIELEAAQARDAANTGGQRSAAGINLNETIESLRSSIHRNKEIFLYGGIAALGILIMGLAVGSASSSRSRTDAQLELLRQEKEKAENLAKLKAEFLNQVSHELRTPLAVIIGYIECIQTDFTDTSSQSTRRSSMSLQSSLPT